MRLHHFILAIIIVISIQFTDYKIFDLKFADLLSLICCILFILIAKDIKLPRFYSQLLIVFLILFFNSLIVSLYTKFYPPPEMNFLKKPGILSISRYIQYTGCVFYSIFIYFLFNSKSINFNKKFFLYIDKIMIFFSLAFLFFFLISWVNINTPFVYSNHRLRGGYVEGGPFGLFISFYLILRILILKKIDIYCILFFILIILSQSKASIFFISSFYLIYLYIEKRLKLAKNIIFSIMVIALLFIANHYFSFSSKIFAYWNDFNEIEYQISLRGENDNSLVMGRIAAMHIAPNMIKDNFILGVGMGNYSLVRNNPKYLQGLPKVYGWDLSGLGGVYNTFIESGFAGLFFLLLPFIYLWKKSNNKVIKHGIILFFLAQIFGVQLYFQYIWFGLGLFYYLGVKNKSAIFE